MLSERIVESQRIIEEAFKRFSNLGLAFSGGSDSLALLNLVLPYDRSIKVLFVNTRDEFPETCQFVDKVRREKNLNLFEFKAEKNLHDEFRKIKDRPKFVEKCCKYHKIAPLLRGIKELNLDAIFVGIRASEHEERAKAGIFEKKDGHTRVHPLHAWSLQDVRDFLDIYGIEANPLYEQGYVSLGCVYCTKKSDKLVERGGRDKTREKIMKMLREAGYT